MREELEDVLELYAGMPLEGQEHWRARSLPSVTFESEQERREFLAALRERDRPPAPATPATTPGAAHAQTGAVPQTFEPGQRVKVNLAGLSAGNVQFSQNVEAVYATILNQTGAEPPAYRVKLLISFRGVDEIDVPAGRIRRL